MRSRLLIALFTVVAGFACAACQQLEDVPASDPTEAHATSTATPPDVAAPAVNVPAANVADVGTTAPTPLVPKAVNVLCKADSKNQSYSPYESSKLKPPLASASVTIKSVVARSERISPETVVDTP